MAPSSRCTAMKLFEAKSTSYESLVQYQWLSCDSQGGCPTSQGGCPTREDCAGFRIRTVTRNRRWVSPALSVAVPFMAGVPAPLSVFLRDLAPRTGKRKKWLSPIQASDCPMVMSGSPFVINGLRPIPGVGVPGQRRWVSSIGVLTKVGVLDRGFNEGGCPRPGLQATRRAAESRAVRGGDKDHCR